MDHVYRGDRAVVGVDEIRLEARDVPGDARLLAVRARLDRVLAGADVDRSVLEVQVLGVGVLRRLLDVLRRGRDVRAWQGGMGGGRAERERENCEDCEGETAGQRTAPIELTWGQ